MKPTVHGNEEDEENDDDDHGHSEMSKLKHFLLTAGIVVSGFTIAYIVDDLRIVATPSLLKPFLLHTIPTSQLNLFHDSQYFIPDSFFFDPQPNHLLT